MTPRRSLAATSSPPWALVALLALLAATGCGDKDDELPEECQVCDTGAEDQVGCPDSCAECLDTCD